MSRAGLGRNELVDLVDTSPAHQHECDDQDPHRSAAEGDLRADRVGGQPDRKRPKARQEQVVGKSKCVPKTLFGSALVADGYLS